MLERHRCGAATPRAAPPPPRVRSSAHRTHPATPARWWRSRYGTASSASPARCRRDWPSPPRDRRDRWRARGSALLRQDQVLPFVHPRDLPGPDDGRAIELLEDRRARDVCIHIDLIALIDRALELRSIEAHAPAVPPCVCKRGARAREFWHLDGRQKPDAAHPVGDDLDRLLRRHMAEGALVLLIEAHAQLFQIARPQRFGRARHRDLVALAGVDRKSVV